MKPTDDVPDSTNAEPAPPLPPPPANVDQNPGVPAGEGAPVPAPRLPIWKSYLRKWAEYVKCKTGVCLRSRTCWLAAVALLIAAGLFLNRYQLSLRNWWYGPSPIEESFKQVSGQGQVSPGGSIVFVHGLDGSATDTWANGVTKLYFPQELGKDFPEVGIWVVNYDASSRRSRGESLAIADRSRVLLEQIKQRGLHENNVVLIGHSLGGLIIKQMLRDAFDSTDATSQEVANRVKGVIFLATPHTGGDEVFQDYANLLELSGLDRRNELTRELRSNSSTLRSLNIWYRNFSKKTDIRNRVFYETRRIPGLEKLVVPENSADPGLGDVEPIPVVADHPGIAKPASKEDGAYGSVAEFVKETLYPLRERWDISFEEYAEQVAKLKEARGDLEEFLKKHAKQRVKWTVQVHAIRDDKKACNFQIGRADGKPTKNVVTIAKFTRWAFRDDIKVSDIIEIEGTINEERTGARLVECRVLNPPRPEAK